MKYFNYIALFIISFAYNCAVVNAQDQPTLIKQLNQKADYINTDQLGNLYLVRKNFIFMYNKDGDSLRAFNSQKFGEIEQIDCSDPYKILVFFKDYNIIVFLDNYLSQNGEAIDLQSINLDQVSLACHSREAGFWAFDQIKQKVMHLNPKFKITHETVNFTQWFGQQLNPNFMIEYNNQLYLNDPNLGIFIFDHFGTFLRKVVISNARSIQIKESIISYLTNNKYCIHSTQKLETQCNTIELNNQIDGYRKEKGRLYILNDKKVSIYKTN